MMEPEVDLQVTVRLRPEESIQVVEGVWGFGRLADDMWWFVDGCSSLGRRWAVRGVCCEEGSADSVESQGEDGEEEGDEGPAGAEGWKDHVGPTTGRMVIHGASSLLKQLRMEQVPRCTHGKSI